MEKDLIKYLDDCGINYVLPPTSKLEDDWVGEDDEVELSGSVGKLQEITNDVRMKTYFLQETGCERFILVIYPNQTRLDNSLMYAILEEDYDYVSLRKAKPNWLDSILQDGSGNISVFSLRNDTNRAVQCFMDIDLWKSDRFSIPIPNDGTSSSSDRILVDRTEIEHFLETINHKLTFIHVPVTTQ